MSNIDSALNDLLADLNSAAGGVAEPVDEFSVANMGLDDTVLNDTAGGAPSGANELDSILGALEGQGLSSAADDAFTFDLPDFNEPLPVPAAAPQPVPTGPICNGCNEAIKGPCLTALNAKWHPEHFCCAECGIPFGNNEFFINDDLPYCMNDYQKLFAVRCAHCERPILDKCISAFGKKYHREHFLCAGCDDPLAGRPYVEREEKPYCKNCKKRLDAEAEGREIEVHECGKCGKLIYGEFIMLKGKYIHPEHFACAECGAALKGGKCFEFEDNLYCEFDYNKLVATQCAGCKCQIDGRALTAVGRQWHPECFKCCICEKTFAGGNFYEKDNKPYCAVHYYKLFGDVCPECSKPIAGHGLKAIGRQWHTDCFCCQGCKMNLNGKVFMECDEKPLCKKCFGKLPSDVRKKAEKERDKRLKEEKERLKREKASGKGKK